MVCLFEIGQRSQTNLQTHPATESPTPEHGRPTTCRCGRGVDSAHENRRGTKTTTRAIWAAVARVGQLTKVYQDIRPIRDWAIARICVLQRLTDDDSRQVLVCVYHWQRSVFAWCSSGLGNRACDEIYFDPYVHTLLILGIRLNSYAEPVPRDHHTASLLWDAGLHFSN